MARYIDAEKLRGRLYEADFYTPDERWRTEREFAELIDTTPTADVVEVKHGEWYKHNKEEHGDTCYYCSVCEQMALSDCMEWELTKYCPNCGAKMDGGDK